MRMIRLLAAAVAVVVGIGAFAASEARADGKVRLGDGVYASESYVLSVSPNHFHLRYGLQPAHYPVRKYHHGRHFQRWGHHWRRDHRPHHWRQHQQRGHGGGHYERDAWNDGGHRDTRSGGRQGGGGRGHH